VYAWGCNKYGQLGINSSDQQINLPENVTLFNEEQIEIT
jgi:alpha-tubulin suppressor-like RCC1 family protein